MQMFGHGEVITLCVVKKKKHPVTRVQANTKCRGKMLTAEVRTEIQKVNNFTYIMSKNLSAHIKREILLRCLRDSVAFALFHGVGHDGCFAALLQSPINELVDAALTSSIL